MREELPKRNKFFKFHMILTVVLILLVKDANGYDFQNGNAAIDIVIPASLSVVLQEVSPGDAPIIFRTETLLSNAWFDALAPFHKTAVGVYTKFPASYRFTENGNKNKNIAILYASYQVLMSLFPKYKNIWDTMMKRAELQPQIIYDPSSAQGIGIAAGSGVVKNRQNDGMNQLGNIKKMMGEQRKYTSMPYWDYTEYKPKNTPYQLKDPSSWQPQIITKGNGIYQTQQFVTPQLCLTNPYSYQNTSIFQIDPPSNSNVSNWNGYLNQAKKILEASTNLNQQKKMKAQFFDNKIKCLINSAIHIQKTNNLSLIDFVHLYFLLNAAAFDAMIPIWLLKAQFDAVRPVSAIKYIYNNTNVRSWGGPGKGAVNNMPSDQWKSYLGTGDHPEYPSASSGFCAAHATAARKFLKSDKLQWKITVKAGQSVKQPGFTPMGDFDIYYKSWSDFDSDCGQSRLWGGVHFPDSIAVGKSIGQKAGNLAYNFVNSHIIGKPKNFAGNTSQSLKIQLNSNPTNDLPSNTTKLPSTSQATIKQNIPNTSNNPNASSKSSSASQPNPAQIQANIQNWLNLQQFLNFQAFLAKQKLQKETNQNTNKEQPSPIIAQNLNKKLPYQLQLNDPSPNPK